MSNHASRLNKLEAQSAPAQKVRYGWIDRCGIFGNRTNVSISGQQFEQIGDESEEALLERAREGTATDHIGGKAWLTI